MQLAGKASRVIIYFGENDRFQGKPLSMVLLEFLKREGASGATVVRGLSGFGARSRIHTANIMTLSEDLPLRLEWVDQPELVQRLLPQLRRMVDDGLITLEEVTVVQYAPGRRPDPLAQPVQNVMRREVTAVSPDTPLDDVVTLLLQRGYRSLPVMDKNGRLCGILTDGDLLQRAGLSARLDLQAALDTDTVQKELATLRRQQLLAGDVMTGDVIDIQTTDTLRQAVNQMVDHDLKRLPVVDKNGRLAGWISRVDVLRTLAYHEPVTEADEPATTGQQITELMYRDVPAVSPDASLEAVLQALERTRRRRAVVIDADRQVMGIITDGDLLRRSESAAHPGIVARLRGLVTGERPSTTRTLLPADVTAADLMSSPALTITPDKPLADALRLMLSHEIKRLPVVDENGRLLGLLGRASLLRSLSGQ